MYSDDIKLEILIDRLNDFVEEMTARYKEAIVNILETPYNDFETYGGFINLFLEDYDFTAFFRHVSRIDLLSQYKDKYDSDIEHFLLDLTLSLYYDLSMQPTESKVGELDPYDEYDRSEIFCVYYNYMVRILKPFGKRVEFEYKISGGETNDVLEYYIKLYILDRVRAIYGLRELAGMPTPAIK